MANKSVIIVGAGIVGLTTAETLVHRGYKVTVVEQQAGVSQGASKGNGGQLCSAFCLPFNAPGFWVRLLRAQSAARGAGFSWTTALSHLAWARAFFNQSTHANYIENATRLLSLGRLAERQLDTMLDRHKLAFHYKKNCGKLYLYRNENALRAWTQLLGVRENLGYRIQVLDKTDCLAVEPALAQSSIDFAGGLYVKESSVGNCAVFSEDLTKKLQAQGVEFIFGFNAKELLHARGRVCGVESIQSAHVEGDAVVLTAGLGAPALLPNGLRRRYRVAPFKGYSVTLPAHNTCLPKGTITDADGAVAVSVLGDKVRISGGVILDARPGVDQRQIQRIVTAAQQWFPAIRELAFSDMAPWAGHRPTTPSGVPYVGATSEFGLFLNFGHGSFGWTLAPATASLVSAQISDYLALR